MRIVVLSYLLFTTLLSAQTLQSTGDTAFIATTGQIIELSLTARTANNTPAANLEVTFGAPQSPTAGEFLDGSGLTTNIRTVRTTIDGAARMRYRILAPNLYATIEATSLGISATVRYALSPPIANFNPSTTLSTAATIVKAAFPGAQVIGPFLLPANTLIRPAVIPTGPYTRYPRVTTAPEYFYWVDHYPGAPFSHPVTFGRLALTAATTENSLESYPPYIQLTAPAFISLSGNSGATYTRPASTGPNTASNQHTLTPADSCAILLRGDQDTQSDLAFQRLRDELVRQERVSPENIFAVEDVNQRTILPATPAALNTLIARARTAACRKLYLFVDSGANTETPGLLLKGDPTITGGLPSTYTYENLVRQLSTLGSIEVQAIFAVPDGLTLRSILEGWGLRGELVTSTSSQKYGAKSAFLNEVSTSYISSNGDLKAVNAALARSLDPETANAQPAVGDVLTTANRFLDLPNAFLETPGTQSISFLRPAGAGTRIPFDIRLTNSNPAIAALPAGIQIPTNAQQTLIPITGLANGLTTITGQSRSDGFAYNGSGSIQVGRFRINPNPCLTIAGGQCNITIERLSRKAPVLAQELALTLADPTLATLPPTKIRFEPNETTKTFVITAQKAGATNLTITPLLYFEPNQTLAIVIGDPPSSAGPNPATCSFTASPTTLTATSTGGLLSFEIRSQNTCVWSSNSTADWITLPPPTSGAGSARIFIQIASNLNNSTRTGAVNVGGQTIMITQPGLATSAPAITSITNGASFHTIASSGSWLTIKGTNLATITRIWAASDFPGDTNLPTSLNSTSVTIGGQPAYVYFISPTQLNVLAPDNLAGPRVEVLVQRGDLESNRFLAEIQPTAPALFLFDADNRTYPAAVHSDGVLAARPGLYPGLTTRAPKPGNIILLYLTGLGETTPATPASRIVATPANTTAKPVVEIGGLNADVLFSGKTSSGLYQLNIRIPQLAAGDHPLRVWLQGQTTGQTVYLTIEP